MKLIDLLCMAPAVFDKIGAACDRLNAFADEVLHASPSIQEYLDEHDRIQRIAEEANRQFRDQARGFAAAVRQPISIQIQIEKER